MSTILDGKQVAKHIAAQLKSAIEERRLKLCLAIVQVGHRPESTTYIKQKIKLGKELGIEVKFLNFDTMITTEGLVEEIQKLNNDAGVQGIIVQLPLPEHIDKEAVINTINPTKDADGLTAVNLRKLMENSKGILPATPRGIVTLLKHYQIPLKGKRVVIVGRSVLVGKSAALIFLNEDATVTVCHRYTENLREQLAHADIIIVATGVPKLISVEDVQAHHVIVDVGINVLTNDNDENAKRILSGDVDFENVKEKVTAITPVPGGVGPMTVVSLFQNIFDAHVDNASHSHVIE